MQAEQEISGKFKAFNGLAGIESARDAIEYVASYSDSKQLRMRTSSDKHHHAAGWRIVQNIDQQEISTDMAFAMACPIAFERVI